VDFRIRERIGWLLVIILLSSLFLNFYFFQKTKNQESGIKVLGVIDGDTLVLEGKVRLRLRSIDAPELQFCLGQEAKNYLEKLVKGKRVEIKEKIIDRSGRPMALVYLDNRLVNEEMLKAGLARYHADQTSVTSRLKAAFNSAREKHLGIFSPQCYQKENSENPDCLIKGNIDKATGKRLYYFPGCAQYEFTVVEKDIGENWFCTEEEAQKAGFQKAKSCYTKKYQPLK